MARYVIKIIFPLLILLFSSISTAQNVLYAPTSEYMGINSAWRSTQTTTRNVNFVIERILSNNGRLPFEIYGDFYRYARTYDYTTGGLISSINKPLTTATKVDTLDFLQRRKIQDSLRIKSMKDRHRGLTDRFLEMYEKELEHGRYEALLNRFTRSRFIYYYSEHPTDPNDLDSAVTLFDASLIRGISVKAPLESFLKQDFPERKYEQGSRVAFIELSSAYKNKELDAENLSNFNYLLHEVSAYIDMYIQNGYKVIIRVLTSRSGRATFGRPPYNFKIDSDYFGEFVDEDTGAQLFVLKADGADFVRSFGSKGTSPYTHSSVDPLWEPQRFINEELLFPKLAQEINETQLQQVSIQQLREAMLMSVAYGGGIEPGPLLLSSSDADGTLKLSYTEPSLTVSEEESLNCKTTLVPGNIINLPGIIRGLVPPLPNAQQLPQSFSSPFFY